MPLRVWRTSHKSRQVDVRAQRTEWARYNQNRVVAEIGESYDRLIITQRSELTGERCGIWRTFEGGRIEQHEFEVTVEADRGDGRCLPPKRGKRRIGEDGYEEGS